MIKLVNYKIIIKNSANLIFGCLSKTFLEEKYFWYVLLNANVNSCSILTVQR